MSSSDRRRFLSLALGLPGLALLSACGFAPAYGPSGPATGLLNKVRADEPQDKNGFDLVGRLEERLGRPSAAAYRLSYRITTKSQGVAITVENAITRYNIDGTATYALHDATTDAVLTEGKVTTFVSYSASGSTVSTQSARDDAYLRLMRLLADQIVTRLIATSSEWSSR